MQSPYARSSQVFLGITIRDGSIKTMHSIGTLRSSMLMTRQLDCVCCLRSPCRLPIQSKFNRLGSSYRLSPLVSSELNRASHVWADDSSGNINQLVIRLAPYMEQLHRSKGVITEFVNPKYADDSRTSFRSATRLECMMQVVQLYTPERKYAECKRE
jgi:hypothetical protein